MICKLGGYNYGKNNVFRTSNFQKWISKLGATAGDNDFNNLNNIGAQFKFFVETAATDMDIKTDGTDKFKGAVMIGVNDGSKKAFVPLKDKINMKTLKRGDGCLKGRS